MGRSSLWGAQEAGRAGQSPKGGDAGSLLGSPATRLWACPGNCQQGLSSEPHPSGSLRAGPLPGDQHCLVPRLVPQLPGWALLQTSPSLAPSERWSALLRSRREQLPPWDTQGWGVRAECQQGPTCLRFDVGKGE